MKGMDKIPFLTKEQTDLLKTSVRMYSQHARIFFEVLAYDAEKKEIVVKVFQNENVSEKYLDTKELVDRTKKVFNFLGSEMKVHVHPTPYNKAKLMNYSVDDVLVDMEKLGIKAKDLVKLLNIDKTSLSSLLNERRELTKYQKAMFFYLFSYLKSKK